METLTPEQLGTDKYRWDLSEFYKGIDDPQIDKDIVKLGRLSKKFNLTYKGKLSKLLGKALSDYSEITILTGKIGEYLFLFLSLDVTNSEVKQKSAEFDRILSSINADYLTFFDLEIVALDQKILSRLYKSDKIVAKHRPLIEYTRIFRPYLFSESVEAVISKRSPFGPSAWGEFFEELESDLEINYKGEKKNLTTALFEMSESKDANLRAEILAAINQTFKGHFSKYSAQTLYMVAGLRYLDTKDRGYPNSMDPRNKNNKIPDKVVDMLHEIVSKKGGELSRRYYKLKAAHLGLKTLRWSDRNAPIDFKDTSVTNFPKSIEISLAGYESFSPKLAELIKKEIISKKRIDAPAVKGKRSGGYNTSFISTDRKPYSFVFLNHLGSARNVMTLAHELGHAVHGLLAGEEQGPLMFQPPMAYAETASIFGEIITFDALKKELYKTGDKKSVLAMLMSKIDEVINNTVRQISFSNFERRVHGIDVSYKKWEPIKKYSVKDLNDIWLSTTKELYGPEGEIFTYENAEHLWCYIPHFHRPFYVYAYAFGQLLAQSLYSQKDRLGKKFEPLYLDLLRAGSTKDAVELLKPFGLDPTKKEFWENGLRVGLEAMIEEAEQLSKEISA